MIPFLVPPNESTSTPKSRVAWRKRLAETHGGVGKARAVHVQKHFVLVRKAGQRMNLFRLVDRPHLGRLRDGDDARLHVMLVADPMVGVPHGIKGDLALLMRQWDELTPGMFFRGAALVAIDVGVVAAQHGMVRPVQRLQAQHIRARTVEGEEHVDPRPEMLFEFRQGRAGVWIVAVSHHVPLIGARNRLQNFRMHPGIVVAGETTSRLIRNLPHKENNVAERTVVMQSQKNDSYYDES